MINDPFHPEEAIARERDSNKRKLLAVVCAVGLTAILLAGYGLIRRYHAQKVLAELKAAGIRCEVDTRGERMNAKVRDAQLQKIPYMLVVGDKEAAANAVAVRLRTNENQGAKPLAEFIEHISGIVKSKSLEL